MTLTIFLATLSVQAQVANYIPIWTSSTTVGDSKIYQVNGNVGIGTTSPGWALDVNARINAATAYLLGGSQVLAQNTSSENLALGYPGLTAITSGVNNTALGLGVLQSNTTGSFNTAIGFEAMQLNTSGAANTATGQYVLINNSSGQGNTGFGTEAAYGNTTGNYNTAVGMGSLFNNATGSYNIAIGNSAAASVSSGNSNNIHIGSPGSSADASTIRIGQSQTSFFAAGIRGVTTGLSNAVEVMIDGNGQLGTVSSSIRLKEDIHDMADSSAGLLRLRPVTYRYKQPYADGSQPLDYGLIAEEVAEIYPDLVARSADGQIQTVQYQKLTPMLLNELQKQAELIRQLEKRLAALESSR